MMIAGEVLGGYEKVYHAAQLENWLTVSQQMMGLFDNNELPFQSFHLQPQLYLPLSSRGAVEI